MPVAAIRTHSTFQAKKNEAHAWFIADLSGKTLGRAATRIASVLRGKHTARFTTHEDAGDFVVVINADKVVLTGNKWDDKKYFDHSLFPGGVRENSAKQLIARHPTSLVERAVKGMLPKGPLGRRLYKKLKVYAGDKHPHAAQQPKVLEIK
jgi:large subunit ribosomal protein L13